MARSSLQTSWLTDSAEGAPLVPPTHQRPSQGQCGGFVDRAVGHGDGVAQAARSGARAARVGGGAGGNSARRCASVGAGPHDRSPRTPELHRPPRTGIAKKKSATSLGSRSAAPAPAAGSVCWRSSLGRRAPRARETAARVVNAVPTVSAAEFGDRCRRPGTSLRSTGAVTIAAVPTRRSRCHHRSHRPSSIVAPNRNLQTKNPLKRTGAGAAGDLTIVRPAAAAPPGRPEQVGLRQSSLESARASRAGNGGESG